MAIFLWVLYLLYVYRSCLLYTSGGGELTENIDDVGGVGTAEFASKAIDIFYMSRR